MPQDDDDLWNLSDSGTASLSTNTSHHSQHVNNENDTVVYRRKSEYNVYYAKMAFYSFDWYNKFYLTKRCFWGICINNGYMGVGTLLKLLGKG